MLTFILTRYNYRKSGNEYFTFTTLLNLEVYIIGCQVQNIYEKRTESHLFVFNANYWHKEKKLKGTIIDNQVHTQLTVLEPIDLVDKTSMSNIYFKLYGGKTDFEFCKLVTKRITALSELKFLINESKLSLKKGGLIYKQCEFIFCINNSSLICQNQKNPLSSH